MLPGCRILLDSYRRNFEAARLEAEQSSLPNVRNRAARAAESWKAMAERLEQVEANKRP
jgi:hypothetical protein